MINRQGNTVAAVLMSLGVVGASVAVFFVYTKDKLEEEANTPKDPAGEVAGVGGGEKGKGGTPTPTDPAVPVKPETNPPGAPDPDKVVVGTRFESSAALAKKIGSQILEGNYVGAAKLISGADKGTATYAEADQALNLIFKEMALKPDPRGFGEIGQTGAAHRYGMKLANGEGGDAGRIVMDLTRDTKQGWKVETIEVPKAVAVALSKKNPPAGGGETVAGGTPTTPGGTDEVPPKKLVVEERPEDALAAAESFVASLLNQNYDAARETSDFKRVSSEKIAGLCIVFEEGEYQMRKTKPLITTAAVDNSAWVIARLEHADGGGGAEFGIELERDDEAWKVVALNLSKLLAAFTQENTTEGLAYAPMVASPQGGQSIALYFEFDDATIHPRAARQLEIVSKVLKGDASKSLKITGHTDTKGEEDYNVKLSKDRASNVKERLLKLGVNVAQIITVGAGESLPLKPNVRSDGTDDPEARSHNRRAEIFLDF